MPLKRDKKPTYIAIAVVAGCVVLAAAVVGVLFAAGVVKLPEPPVPVPNVTGLDAPTARSRLAEAGLIMRRGDTRFSASVPAGGIVDQSPSAGTMVQPGSVIVVAVSGGSESFSMPDVTGLPLAAALETLKQKGLTARVERVESKLASGTVASTLPSPGAEVSTADTVTVRVSAGATSAALLLPYQLKGIRIVIDPEPAATSPDVSDEVTRRLRSLLEASGAQVTVTRSVVDSSPPITQRQLAALDGSGTVIVQLTVAASGPGGIHMATVSPDGKSAPYYLASLDIAKQTATAFKESGMKAQNDPPSSDPVLTSANAPGLRLQLGSYTDKQDLRDFRDPSWVDIVGRAIYRGIGQTFAPRAELAPGLTVPATGGAGTGAATPTGP
jgi:beta-lactam-binding protein with PASTA domain